MTLRWLHLARTFRYVHELLTGIPRPDSTPHYSQFLEAPQGVRTHIVYGARKVGWRGDRLPWRYSLPTDIDEIVDELNEMDDDLLLQNGKRAWEQRSIAGTTDSASPLHDGHSRSENVKLFESRYRGRLLPTLHEFYQSAQRENEIVLYDLG